MGLKDSGQNIALKIDQNQTSDLISPHLVYELIMTCPFPLSDIISSHGSYLGLVHLTRVQTPCDQHLSARHISAGIRKQIDCSSLEVCSVPHALHWRL